MSPRERRSDDKNLPYNWNGRSLAILARAVPPVLPAYFRAVSSIIRARGKFHGRAIAPNFDRTRDPQRDYRLLIGRGGRTERSRDE